MAKYTMALSEYLLDGYTLPSSFSQIEDFDDLFTGYYFTSEIGFETPELFEIRLATKAELVIPLYASKIARYNEILSVLGTPNKEIHVTGSNEHSGTDTLRNTGTDTTTKTGTDTVGHTGSVTAGAQKRTRTDLPVNVSTATPSGIENADAYTNSDTATDTTTHNTQSALQHGMTAATEHGLKIEDDHTTSYTGLDVSEQLALLNEYEKKIVNLKQACLDEFKTLFMVIY